MVYQTLIDKSFRPPNYKMENTFDLSASIVSKNFDTLHYDDIKGVDKSVQGASWKDFETPNRSSSKASFALSSLSSLASPADAEEIMKRLEKIRQSKTIVPTNIFPNSLLLEDIAQPQYIPSESNEFLRKKTNLANDRSNESIRRSAESIIELVLTGSCTEGLPDSVNIPLVVEVMNGMSKRTGKKPTIEHLMRFVEMLKEENPGQASKTRESKEIEMKLRRSTNEIVTLHKTMHEYQEQIKVFQDAIKDSMNLMKDINEKWNAEKREADKLREMLKAPKDEVIALKEALLSCERLLDMERKGRRGESRSSNPVGVQTDDTHINEILEQNKLLKGQMKQNLETVDKLAEIIANSKNYEKMLQDKENQLKTLTRDKQELVEAVEQLVESAQKIMESSKGSKQQKLRMFAEMMGSLKSFSLSDLQR